MRLSIASVHSLACAGDLFDFTSSSTSFFQFLKMIVSPELSKNMQLDKRGPELLTE